MTGETVKTQKEIVEELNLSKDQFNFNRQQNHQERKKDENN